MQCVTSLHACLQARPFAVGLNCALGAADMKPYIANLAKCADCYVFAYPNAGLPNAMGGYDQKDEEMAAGGCTLHVWCSVCSNNSSNHVAILGTRKTSPESRHLRPEHPNARSCRGEAFRGGGSGECVGRLLWLPPRPYCCHRQDGQPVSQVVVRPAMGHIRCPVCTF